MSVFSLFRLAIFLSGGYSIYRYREVWHRTKLSIIVYWILQMGLLGNYYFLGYRSGVYPNETIHNIMSVISGLYFMYFFYSGFMCIIRDLIIQIFGKKSDGKIIRFFRRPERGLLVFFCITIFLGIAGVIGMRTNRFVNYEISVQKETSLEQLRIAMISDAHMGTGVTRNGLTKIVDKINEEHVDVVLIVGDFFDNATTESLKQHTTKELTRLQCKYGTFFVEGNHEVYLRGEDQSVYFRRAGVRVLHDEIATIADGITIVGRKDFRNDPIATWEIMKNVNKTKPIILLAHQPKELQESADEGVDLQVSGHTHGGQFPLGNINSSLSNDMNYGIRQIGDFHAVTTSGIGGWSVPVKLFYPSEIVLITIKFS